MDNVIIFEAPKIEKPEFRLYYDEQGKVICYTCEKLEGNFVVIDANTFAEGRPDIRVVDGKISKINPHSVISKLKPNSEQGITCAQEDISIVVDENYDGNITLWKLVTNEYN